MPATTTRAAAIAAPPARPQVVIVGGGFGGLRAAQGLRGADVDVTLVDRRNFHLFQPLLYQVATGALSPANIAAPLRDLLKRQRNARVLLAEVVDVDLVGRRVRLADGELPFDALVVAAGSRHHYFGHDDWAQWAPGLKTVEDATAMRARVLGAFEQAERAGDDQARAPWLTFVIVGGGPTGVELAGALAEVASATLRGNFRSFDPARARIVLVEAGDRLLPAYHAASSQRAAESLARLGVEVRLETTVTGIGPDAVALRRAHAEERLPTRCVLWSAGVGASPLGRALASAAGVHCDRAGRVPVEPDLTLPGHPQVFVIGDLAAHLGADGRPLPGVAPVAMQQGEHAARVIRARLRGADAASVPPFRYRDRGSMAVIGRHHAVAEIAGLRLSGRAAWLAWLFIHLMYLVSFQARLLVLLQWLWAYITRNRSARLITGEAIPDGQVATGTAEGGAHGR